MTHAELVDLVIERETYTLASEALERSQLEARVAAHLSPGKQWEEVGLDLLNEVCAAVLPTFVNVAAPAATVAPARRGKTERLDRFLAQLSEQIAFLSVHAWDVLTQQRRRILTYLPTREPYLGDIPVSLKEFSERYECVEAWYQWYASEPHATLVATLEKAVAGRVSLSIVPSEGNAPAPGAGGGDPAGPGAGARGRRVSETHGPARQVAGGALEPIVPERGDVAILVWPSMRAVSEDPAFTRVAHDIMRYGRGGRTAETGLAEIRPLVRRRLSRECEALRQQFLSRFGIRLRPAQCREIVLGLLIWESTTGLLPYHLVGVRADALFAISCSAKPRGDPTWWQAPTTRAALAGFVRGLETAIRNAQQRAASMYVERSATIAIVEHDLGPTMRLLHEIRGDPRFQGGPLADRFIREIDFTRFRLLVATRFPKIPAAEVRWDARLQQARVSGGALETCTLTSVLSDLQRAFKPDECAMVALFSGDRAVGTLAEFGPLDSAGPFGRALGVSRNALRLMLQNLISNAVRVRNHARCVRLDAEIVRVAGRDYARVHVSDDGDAFEPGVRQGRSGLGIPIIQALCEALRTPDDPAVGLTLPPHGAKGFKKKVFALSVSAHATHAVEPDRGAP